MTNLPPSYAFVPLDNGVRELMESISTCREPTCPVPKKHPYYHNLRGCMPVVPTWLKSGKIMILGEYPTCRYGTEKNEDTGESEYFVPVGDIDEPLENSRYFDKYSIRDVRSGTVFDDGYIHPAGLKKEDLWITNLVKCFLFKQGHVNAYKKLGWNDPPVEESHTEYFTAAAACLKQNLNRELELCKPKLVIALGEKVLRMVHGDGNTPTSQEDLFKKLVGKPLRANEHEIEGDSRHGLFLSTNVFHMIHPSKLMRDEPDSYWSQQHWQEHIPALKSFLSDLGLASDAQVEQLAGGWLKYLQPFVNWLKGMK